MDKDKQNKLAKLAEKLNTKHKAKTLVLGSELSDFETISTPFASVNALIKGVPRGRYTVIAGPEHVGKGAFCVQLAAHNQSIDPNFVVMWSDFENSFDKSWAAKLGLDLERTIFHQYTKEINTMEKMMDIALELLKSEAIDMWVIDSIGAMLPKGDVMSGKEEKSLEDNNMLNLQRKLGEFFRKANVIVNRNLSSGYKGCAVVMIGQVNNCPPVQKCAA